MFVSKTTQVFHFQRQKKQAGVRLMEKLFYFLTVHKQHVSKGICRLIYLRYLSPKGPVLSLRCKMLCFWAARFLVDLASVGSQAPPSPLLLHVLSEGGVGKLLFLKVDHSCYPAKSVAIPAEQLKTEDNVNGFGCGPQLKLNTHQTIIPQVL